MFFGDTVLALHKKKFSLLPDSDTNSESSVPDVIKRVTRLRLSDVEQDEATTQTPETGLPSGEDAITTTQDEAAREGDLSTGDSTSDVLLSRDATCASAEEKGSQGVDCVMGGSKEERTELHFSPARKVCVGGWVSGSGYQCVGDRQCGCLCVSVLCGCSLCVCVIVDVWVSVCG